MRDDEETHCCDPLFEVAKLLPLLALVHEGTANAPLLRPVLAPSYDECSLRLVPSERHSSLIEGLRDDDEEAGGGGGGAAIELRVPLWR